MFCWLFLFLPQNFLLWLTCQSILSIRKLLLGQQGDSVDRASDFWLQLRTTLSKSMEKNVSWVQLGSNQQQWASPIEFLKNYSSSSFFFFGLKIGYFSQKKILGVCVVTIRFVDNDLCFYKPILLLLMALLSLGKLVCFPLPLYRFSILSYTQMLKLDLGQHNYAIITMIIFSCHWKQVPILIFPQTSTDAISL